MNDLISRQAAINAADRADYTGLAVEDVKKVTDEVIKELKQIPTADVIAVVRCENCEYYRNMVCQNPNGLPRYLDGNEFCSYGIPNYKTDMRERS